MADQKKSKRKNALGRGLGALLSDAPSEDKQKISSDYSPDKFLDEIPITAIETNPFQPRSDFDQDSLKELADSISVQGIIQPVTVRKTGNKFQLISGERRLQASKLAGLKKIPAYIRTANDQQMLEMSLIENIQRKDLNAIEIALSYQRLITDCNLKQEELGERVGKDRTTVNNYLRLLKLPPDIQVGIRDQKISMGHARALVNIEHVETQIDIFKKIIKEDLSVRKAEKLARESTANKKTKTKTSDKPGKKPYEIIQLENKLTSHFGTKIEVLSNEKNKGEIRIPFISVDDLNRILDLLKI